MKTQLILIAFTLIFAPSCSYKYYNTVNATFEVIEVKAVDLEEDDWFFSSGSDEVITKYTIASIDADGNLYKKQQRSYGPDDFSQRGEVHVGFGGISVKVPAKGQLVIAAALIEDDDLSNISNAIDDIQFLVDVAGFVAKSSSASRTTIRRIGMASRVLNWTGILVTIVDFFDTNDILLSKCLVINAEQLRKLGGQDLVRTFKGSGKNNFDHFHYEMTYSLSLKNTYEEVVKERDKKEKKSPSFIASVYPYLANKSFNNYWVNGLDKFLVEDPNKENSYLWGGGFSNKEFSADLSILLSPTFKLGPQSRSRFFLLGRYSQTPYYANFANETYAFDPDTYFDIASTANASSFALDTLELNLRALSLGPYLKIMTKGLAFDIGGGVVFGSGRLNFEGVETNGGVTFKYDENTELLENSLVPYAMASMGVGTIGRKAGFVVNVSTQLLFSNFSLNDQFQIYADENRSTLADLKTENQVRANWHFGLSFLF